MIVTYFLFFCIKIASIWWRYYTEKPIILILITLLPAAVCALGLLWQHRRKKAGKVTKKHWRVLLIVIVALSLIAAIITGCFRVFVYAPWEAKQKIDTVSFSDTTALGHEFVIYQRGTVVKSLTSEYHLLILQVDGRDLFSVKVQNCSHQLETFHIIL